MYPYTYYSFKSGLRISFRNQVLLVGSNFTVATIFFTAISRMVFLAAIGFACLSENSTTLGFRTICHARTCAETVAMVWFCLEMLIKRCVLSRHLCAHRFCSSIVALSDPEGILYRLRLLLCFVGAGVKDLPLVGWLTLLGNGCMTYQLGPGRKNLQ